MHTKVVPISALKDNYIWAIHHPQKPEIVVVDPGDSEPVLYYLHTQQVSLTAILVTHHHWDHTQGIIPLKNAFPQIAVYGPKHLSNVTHPVAGSSSFSVHEGHWPFRVLAVPGHTHDHIAFFGNHSLFCGDALFSCGCGRLFEGTPEEMVHSLAILKALPPETLLYCGHEYTLSNIRFAKQYDPENVALQQREREAKKQRDDHCPTLPVSLAMELATNPFLRLEAPAIQKAIHIQGARSPADPVRVFSLLREWKDRF